MKTSTVKPYKTTASIALAITFGILPMLAISNATQAADANYTLETAQKFMRSWTTLGPFMLPGDMASDEDQKELHGKTLLSLSFLDEDPPQAGHRITVNGQRITWSHLASDRDQIAFDKVFKTTKAAFGWAASTIEAKHAKQILLGLGSDDAVKVWLNGKLVHENWALRPVRKDEDLVSLPLRKGTNHLLIRVHNVTAGWGFMCRILDEENLNQRLIAATQSGDRNEMEQLLDHGADINAKSEFDLTPLHVAKLRGKSDIIDLLAERGADESISMPAPETLTDNILKSRVKPDTVGATVLVSRDGKILLEKAYGLADRGNKTKTTTDTKFRIGSVTKQFAGAAILKLQEQGKLSVKDKLSKFVPNFPRGDEVTIEHLVAHTSGIKSFTSMGDFMKRVTSPISPEEQIEYFKDAPYDFDPGERWMYNNSGYFLLGHIVAQVSGKSFNDFLQDEFFKPLGMSNTGIYDNANPPPNEAKGYSFEGGEIVDAVNWDMSWAGAAGALYSTVGDLHRWNEGIFSGKALTRESLKLAFAPAKTTDGKSTGYGYGWGINENRGVKRISHSGGLNGFLSVLMRYPDEKLTIAVLVNSHPQYPGVNPGNLAEAISQLFLWDKMEQIKSVTPNTDVDADKLADYVGRYDYGQAVMAVTRLGDKLFAQLTGQGVMEIVPQGDDKFAWKVVAATVKFIRDDKGKVTSAEHSQGGVNFDAPRLESPIKADRKVMSDYEGEYQYGPAVMTVKLEKKSLYAQLTGQPPFEIVPIAKDVFVWNLIKAKVSFKRDGDGKVTHAHQEQGGQAFDAPKIK